MLKFKKLMAILLALVMMLGAFAACTTPDNPDNPGTDKPNDPNTYTGEMADGGNTYADPNWLPVVKQPISVTATIRNDVETNEWNCRTIWQEIADKTGVLFNIEVLAKDENEALMFASRNYPDCTFRLYNTGASFDTAKEMGDVIELDPDMLEKYAPNWYGIFENYPEIYQLSLYKDGKLYALPNFVMEESTYALRDLNIINVAWLDEVGMDMPTTTEEFADFLRAVKNAAGTGSIPETVIPLQVRHHVDIAGWYPILDWFGCYLGFSAEYIEDGKVKSNMGNPDIKPAFNYMAQLYYEGLIQENFRANTWDDYVKIYADVQAGTPQVAASFTYDMPESEDYQCFAPLDTGTGAESTTHDFGFETRMITNTFAIFKNTKYPVAILRAIDQYATGDNAVRASYGEEDPDQDKAYWHYDENGEQVIHTFMTEGKEESVSGWVNYGPDVITENDASALYSMQKVGNTRTYWYYELYRGTLPENKTRFTPTILSYLTPEEQSEAATLLNNLSSINANYTYKWIVGASNVNDDWDEYVEKLNNIGLTRRLELLQKAYDAYQAAAIK